MKYIGDRVQDINIAYIGGGSRGWAWGLMGDLAMEARLSGTVRLYDIRYEGARDNAIIGNALSQRDDVHGKWTYTATRTWEETLAGADFVVISILPGTFDEMASDVHTPEQYGIYQSVGDTTGPGGIVRAMRTVPMYVEIAEQIRQHCPDAWVINYTNPMTVCTRTLYEVFPQIKAFGCCHEVFETQRLLATMLKQLHGIEADRSEIDINVLGINHFTWFDQARYQGIDLFPIYRDFVEQYHETGFKEDEEEYEGSQYFRSANRVQFDLFRKYGLIAVSGDRHLAEFLPGNWYLKDPETVASWKFGLTPISWRKKKSKLLAERSERLVSGQEQLKPRSSGEEGVRMIRSLLGFEPLVTNVNMPNRGQMESIPLGAVVETNAVITSDSVRPVTAGRLPLEIENWIVRHVLNQETIVKASINRDKELAFRAFLNDPLVRISSDEAQQLFTQMLHNTKTFLPGWDI